MRANSYAVDTAEEGEDGLFKAGCTDCDALVFDVMLPGASGHCPRIANDELPLLPPVRV